ncbi:MAG: hypothetical protein KC613_03010, partial [Myxococcales bacterium]|nr:hypothetical protein [Myxococcales bacterium]
MRRALFPALFALCALPACDDGESAGPPGDQAVDQTPASDGASSDMGEPDLALDGAVEDPCALENGQAYAVGAWTVTVDDTSAFEITAPHGEVVLRGAPNCPAHPARKATGAPFQRTLFGAFQIELEGERSDLFWLPMPVSLEVNGELLGPPRTGAFLSFSAADHGSLRVRLTAQGPADAVELPWGCGADEGFFGLGTQVVGPDLRGHTFPLWTQEQGNGKDGTIGFPLGNTLEAAYAPMGVWHSSAGYAAVIDHDGYSELDLCAGGNERVALRTLDAHTGFVLVPGATPRERMAGVTAWTGRPPAVPAWTFAPWNDAVGGPGRLFEVAERLRAEGIPSSAIWSEDWIGGEQSATGYRLSYAWAWDPATYPDLPQDVARLHADGFAFLAYFNTFVPEPTAMFQEGIDGGFLVKNAAGEVITFQDPAFRNAGLIDLTNPDARAWMAGYKRLAADEYGVDGWMADFSEWLPVEAVMADGQTGWQFHNRYPLAYQQLNREAMEAVHDGTDDWLFFSRSGWASTTGGASGLAPVLWGGDQDTDWARDDGFPSVIPIGTNAGLAGVAYFGTDIAGYSSLRSPNTTKELFYRWSSQGALTPVMRTHHGS